MYNETPHFKDRIRPVDFAASLVDWIETDGMYAERLVKKWAGG